MYFRLCSLSIFHVARKLYGTPFIAQAGFNILLFTVPEPELLELIGYTAPELFKYGIKASGS